MAGSKKSKNSKKSKKSSKVISLDAVREEKAAERKLRSELDQFADYISDQIEELVSQGMDYEFAPYLHAIAMMNAFVDSLAASPDFRDFYDIVDTARGEFMPLDEPTGPVSDSFFTYWSLFDVPFTEDGLSVAEEILEGVLAEPDPRGENIGRILTLRNLIASRCGFFSQVGVDDAGVYLREVPGGKEQLFLSQSGFEDLRGIWFCRIIEDLSDDHPNLIVTTPYILIEEESRVVEYMKRNEPISRNRRHFFRGRHDDPYYWFEYIYDAFVDDEGDRILLQGLPDEFSEK